MTTAVLSPLPVQKFFDNNGSPLANGLLFTYQAGTTTKLATYTDSTGGTPNTNPIVLNARGECNLWLPPNVAYKFVLSPSTDTDPPTSPIWTVDQLVNSQLITLYGGVDTGVANAYIINFVASFTSYTDGIAIYWTPANTNTGASTINVNGLGAIAIVNQDGSALGANQILANQIAFIIYTGGKFILASSFSSGAFIGTLTGCTTSPTATFKWSKNGDIVVLLLPSALTATSNSVNCTVTGLPAALTPASQSQAYVQVFDNTVGQIGSVAINGTTLTLGLGTSFAAGGFTAAGTKGLGGGNTITYKLT